MKQQVILYPYNFSAQVCGVEVTGSSATELYVNVIEQLLKQYPIFIGLKETHFTFNSARAEQYTGTTRTVKVNGSTVYINTGFSTKNKWNSIEATCQLLGVEFVMKEDIIIVDDRESLNNDGILQKYYTLYSVAYDNLKKEKPDFCEGLSKESVISIILDLQKKVDENEFEKIKRKAQERAKFITQTTIKGAKKPNSKLNDEIFPKSNYKKLNYDAITSSQQLVHDDLGDWKLGHHNPPKGKEKLIIDSVPLYNINGVEGINAHTYELVFEKMIYAKGNAIYAEDYGKICECNNVIQLLWAGGLLFITELVDLTYKCRQEYEFCQGDWGFMSDDYTPVLQVRVVNMEGRELFVTKQTDTIVSVVVVKLTDDVIAYCALDLNYQLWKIKKQNDTYHLSQISKLEEVIKKYNISFYDFTRKYDNIVTFTDKSFVVLDAQGEYSEVLFEECMTLNNTDY